MTICLECGAHASERVSRGPLVMQREPQQAYWRGMAFRLTKAQFEILYLLCARREVSHFGIEMVGAGSDTTGSSCKVQISLLRRRLPRGLTIQSIHGWGYRLIVQERTMLTIKERAAQAVAAMPEDVTGAILLTRRATGEIEVFGTGGGAMVLHTLGMAVMAIGAKAQQAAAKGAEPVGA